MKKSTVVLIAGIAIACFAGLLYYGLRHARGKPVLFILPAPVLLEVPYIDKDVDLGKDLSIKDWSSMTATNLDMIYQVTALPWPGKLTPTVGINAFHNKTNIYFYMHWKDSTEDHSRQPAKFTDACAIMFPLDKKAEPSTLMMGFLGKANIWQWKASQDRQYWSKDTEQKKTYADYYYPFDKEEILSVSEEKVVSAINDLITIRIGTITAKEKQNVQGRGIWTNGEWYVVFKRSLSALDREVDATFLTDTNNLCAFAVWNGSNGDRGGRKSISGLIQLKVK